MTQEEEWSCGICTFLNKPLYLSCEMCGQDRPTQRPSPPQRQRSMDPDEMDTFEEEPPRRRMDRAPRSVQRHVSSSRVDLGGGVMGTLIMTDDPDDYETPDGKKPEDDADEEEDSLQDLDPAMDDRRRRHSPMSSPRRESYEPRRPVRRTLPERRHTFQTPEDYPAPPARASYNSYQQQQQQMGDSFSRLNGSYGNFDDSFSRGMSSSGVGRHHRQHQQHHHHMRPRPEIQIVGQSNGLPVISRAGQAVQRQGSVNRIMSDSSNQSSHFSGDSSGRRRPSLASSSSVRHFDPSASSRTLGRTSANNDFLPSLDPPPVPMMDNPADVDPQSVFANDQEKNRRRSANEVRRDRGQMLDNINISVSLRSNGLGSPAPISPRASTTTPPAMLVGEPHPALVEDEALDSPRTRKEKKKLQRRKLKGAVKGLMATMRISAAVTN